MTEDQKRQIVSELLATVLVIAMYWVSMQPEWKLELYLSRVQSFLRIPMRDGLSAAQRIEIERFRSEITAYEHAQKRDGNAG
jgi:hypothetical protein